VVKEGYNINPSSHMVNIFHHTPTSALTGTVTINNTIPKPGDILTATYNPGNGTGTTTWQWLRGVNTPIGSDSNTYTVQTTDIGTSIRVVVTFSGNTNSVTSDTVGPVTWPQLGGTVGITGVPLVFNTLTADTSGLSGNGSFSYRWRRDGTDIGGATNSTYIVEHADIDSVITVTVTRSENSGSATSEPTAAVPKPVIITGTTLVFNRLTADTGGLGGSGNISWQWRRGGAIINGATTNTYIVGHADIDLVITVTVTRSESAGSVSSDPTSVVPRPTVKVTGLFNEGATLTADIFNLGGGEDITYQWNRGGTAINNATSVTYTVQTADLVSFITVVIGHPEVTGFITSALFPSVEMVRVPGGIFELGRNLGIGGGSDVTPVSTVTMTGFYIGKYPVTQGLYQAVMGNNPSWFTTANGRLPATGEVDVKRPVEVVRWYEAIVFCNRLSILEGLTPAYEMQTQANLNIWSSNPDTWGPVPTTPTARWERVRVVPGSYGYRLPTEAQWEYAAKGGNGSPGEFTFAGSNNANNVAWHSGQREQDTRGR
jgi:hypothetical protein